MLKTIILSFIEDLLRHISGPVGISLRRFWYVRRLQSCGENLRIEPGVSIVEPAHISLGDDVWIDRHVTLIAGPGPLQSAANANDETGQLVIGSSCHLGIGTIIQAHAGVKIGDAFTSGPGVKIYSASNDQYQTRHGTHAKGSPVRATPVTIGRNVWLGINGIVVGHTIGNDVFVTPNSVVASDIANNSIAGGNPVTFVKHRFSDDTRHAR